MKIICYAQNEQEISKLQELNVSEIIVSTKMLSRFAQTDFDELVSILAHAKNYQSKIVLEWDALYQENRFQQALETFKKLPLHDISEVRLQDPGTIRYVKENCPWMKVQLILETGNHNIVGLKRWRDYLGNQLSRMVLSNELSREHLDSYSKDLEVPIEVLVYGRILLFYSPRGLLSPVLNLKDEYLETKGTSEESPHSGFPLIENAHGTFMFNVKDLSLVEHASELTAMGIDYLRIDNRFDQTNDQLPMIINKMRNPEAEYKITNDRPFIKGFYNINKTDVLFVKLKNNRIARNDQNYVGEILDVDRDSHLCLWVKKEHLNIADEMKIKIVTPEGKIKETIVHEFKNSSMMKINSLLNECVVIIPYVSGVTAKSQVYLLPKT